MGVGNSGIEEPPGEAWPPPPTLSWDGIVGHSLIHIVDAASIGIVVLDRCGDGYRHHLARRIPTIDGRFLRWRVERREEVHWLTIIKGIGREASDLSMRGLTALKIFSLTHQILREFFSIGADSAEGVSGMGQSHAEERKGRIEIVHDDQVMEAVVGRHELLYHLRGSPERLFPSSSSVDGEA